MQADKPVFSKWIIEGMKDYVFGSDGELYRLPFTTWPNHYGLRRIKIQKGNRWRIGDQWWSQRQLRHKVKINPNPQILIQAKPDLPF